LSGNTGLPGKSGGRFLYLKKEWFIMSQKRDGNGPGCLAFLFGFVLGIFNTILKLNGGGNKR
jgi:hypothetical protein